MVISSFGGRQIIKNIGLDYGLLIPLTSVKIDFKSIFAENENAGVQYGVVEVEEYNFEPLVSCQKSFDFLNAADYVDF